MNELANEHKALARVCHEIVALGSQQFEASALRKAFGNDGYTLLQKIGINLIRGQDDPFRRYYSQWPWRDLPEPDFSHLISVDEKRPVPRDNYWKSGLAEIEENVGKDVDTSLISPDRTRNVPVFLYE